MVMMKKSHTKVFSWAQTCDPYIDFQTTSKTVWLNEEGKLFHCNSVWTLIPEQRIPSLIPSHSYLTKIFMKEHNALAVSYSFCIKNDVLLMKYSKEGKYDSDPKVHLGWRYLTISMVRIGCIVKVHWPYLILIVSK